MHQRFLGCEGVAGALDDLVASDRQPVHPVGVEEAAAVADDGVVGDEHLAQNPLGHAFLFAARLMQCPLPRVCAIGEFGAEENRIAPTGAVAAILEGVATDGEVLDGRAFPPVVRVGERLDCATAHMDVVALHYGAVLAVDEESPAAVGAETASAHLDRAARVKTRADEGGCLGGEIVLHGDVAKFLVDCSRLQHASDEQSLHVAVAEKGDLRASGQRAGPPPLGVHHLHAGLSRGGVADHAKEGGVDVARVVKLPPQIAVYQAGRAPAVVEVGSIYPRGKEAVARGRDADALQGDIRGVLRDDAHRGGVVEGDVAENDVAGIFHPDARGNAVAVHQHDRGARGVIFRKGCLDADGVLPFPRGAVPASEMPVFPPRRDLSAGGVKGEQVPQRFRLPSESVVGDQPPAIHPQGVARGVVKEGDPSIPAFLHGGLGEKRAVPVNREVA